MTDPRQTAPSALRNREPILSVLRAVLPQSGSLLEIASGTGEHVAHFAANLPGWVFQPSNRDAAGRASIDAWAEGLANIRPAIALDVTQCWPDAGYDAILCINMIHIAPWEAGLALLDGAARLLRPQGLLILYGPYRVGGSMSDSNMDFDADLRSRDPSWGIRDLETVSAEAAARGLAGPEVSTMPANNLTVVFHQA